MTLNEYITGLQLIVAENFEHGKLPVIYAQDDEGNSYQSVHSNGTPGQVEDPKAYCPEFVGYYDGTPESEIVLEDVNVIIIN